MVIKKLEHVALMVDNIDESIKFYTEVFGFQLKTRGENAEKAMAFLIHPGDSDMEVELVEDFKDKEGYSEKGKVNHLAFTVENMDEAVSYCKDKGLEFINNPGVNAVTGAKSVFFYGPSRELLQLIQPSS